MTSIETLLRNHEPIIALDGDGVLFDYNATYASVWEQAFGEKPLKHPHRAYHAKNQYAMHFASIEHKKHFYDTFAEHGWQNMMPLPGAVEACQNIANLGFSLVIVSSMPPEHGEKRMLNAKKLNMPIQQVHAVYRAPDASEQSIHNPKKDIIQRLQPVVFLDDLLTNFYGLDNTTHCAWLRWDTFDNPNPAEHQQWAHSVHDSMPEFAQWIYQHEHALKRRSLSELEP